MFTGEKMVNSLVDELNEMGMPSMATSLDKIYHSERFLTLDHLTLMSELIGSEYETKISKRINNRLRHAKLIGCPQSLEGSQDSATREYLSTRITDVLFSMTFIRDGLFFVFEMVKMLYVVVCESFSPTFCASPMRWKKEEISARQH